MFSRPVKNKRLLAVVLFVAVYIAHLPQRPDETNRAAGSVFDATGSELLHAAPADEKQSGDSSTLVFQPNETFQKIADRLTPTVASISSSRSRRSSGQSQGETLSKTDRGVTVSAEGLILTNNHVIENADDIRVALPDGRAHAASVTGSPAELRGLERGEVIVSIDRQPVNSVEEVGDALVDIPPGTACRT
ncbi:MAG: hypothetical protein JRK26_06140 [Deltaproteobacteria bacterium]|nr:hypothetical protein [Deltaproteobacteria bacterium]